MRKFCFIFLLILISTFFVNAVNIANAEKSNEFYVHIIDVGEGDAILIQSPDNEFMMIDTGEYTAHRKVYEYFDSLNIKKFKYLVLTHHHSDHVDLAPEIIKDYSVENLIIPYDLLALNNFMRKVAEKAEEKNINIIYSEPGKEFEFDNLKFIILAPNSTGYKDPNDYSIAVKMTYGNNSFMFTGDMTATSENEVMEFAEKNGINLKCDVLKVAHHGSKSSTQESWLEKVKPEYAIISTGEYNVEGHPGEITIENLKKFNVKLYRTDTYGNVIIKSDGNNIEISNRPDIPSSWAKKEIQAAIKSELIPVKLQKNYQKNITRGEAVQIFINLIEKVSEQSIDDFINERKISIGYNKNAFTDTDDKNISAAYALGIINGVGNNMFAPDNILSRAQAAAVINRIALLFNVDIKNGYTHKFNDLNGHWVESELGWVVHAGIIKGVEENRFEPNGNLTKEQAIIIAYRAFIAFTNPLIQSTVS